VCESALKTPGGLTHTSGSSRSRRPPARGPTPVGELLREGVLFWLRIRSAERRRLLMGLVDLVGSIGSALPGIFSHEPQPAAGYPAEPEASVCRETLQTADPDCATAWVDLGGEG
jgi:hypothetical protein